MHMAADEVIAHCEEALALLEEECDEVRWRVHWVGAMALLRMIGHVLEKVDAQRDEEFARRLQAAWREWNSDLADHVIFREFIKPERDNLLKEFRSSIHPSGMIPILIENVLVQFTEDENGDIDQLEILDENIFRPRLEGYGAGEDARDLYRTALDWWRKQITLLRR
jgi:hypothetical protein